MRVSYAGFIYDDKEIDAVSRVLRDRKSLMGEKTKLFENKIASLFGKKFGIMVNSGSSANLLALEILQLPEGSEIITPILTFSTTIAPIVQKKLNPVFIDVEPGTYIINVDDIEKHITKNTKALFIPLLLGNVPDMQRLRKIADKYKLVFIEDSCDTLGATFKGKPTGFYSDISTTSFYGSHIISGAGGGGMICVNNKEWVTDLKVLRGWGRMSSIADESEDIEKRFGYKIDNFAYDSKFIFNKIGYNFLPLEISSAFALEQLKKLKKFSNIRHKNFTYLHKFFEKYKNWFELPKQNDKVATNWLAFPLTIKNDAPFSRLGLVTFLEKNNVQTRPVFTGNILKQPGFKNINHKTSQKNYSVADFIMERSFLIGCHHGMTKEHVNYLILLFERFFQENLPKKNYQK